jgi:hypothetical protein
MKAAKYVFLVVAMLVFVVSSQAAEVARGPVVLYQDGGGVTFTLDVKSNGRRGYIITRRAVAAAEIAAIETQGYNVVYLPDPSQATSGITTKSLSGSIPSSFNILRLYGSVYGTIWTSAMRPAGMSTQWLVFDFSSDGFGSGEHAPISLFLDESKLEGSPPFIYGNGMIIGDVHLRPNDDGGCGSTSWPSVPVYNAQVESFGSISTWIYGETCLNSGLQNGQTYNFTLHANINSWVAFWTPTEYPPAVYTWTQNPTFNPNNGGVLFSVTNDNPSGGNFSLHFNNVGTGWF